MNKILGRAIARISYLPKTLDLVWTASKGWTIVWAILLVIQGLTPVAMVYLTRAAVDGLVAVMGAGVTWQSAQPIIIPAAAMACVLLVGGSLQTVMEWVRTAQSEFVHDHITTLIHQKSVAVDYAFYESSEYYDRLNRARSDASGQSLSLLENLGNGLQNSITLLSMAAILLPYGAWLAVVILISALPSLYIMLNLNRYYHRWWEQSTTERRRVEYYDVLLTNSNTAAELRLFNLGQEFQSAYLKSRHRLRAEYLQIAKIQGLGRLSAMIVGLLVFIAPLSWIVWRILQGKMTLGELALFFQAFQQSRSVMSSLLGNLGQIYRSSLFVSNLFEFLELKPQIVSPPQPQPIPKQLKQGISFQQVSFEYPGSDRPVLENFNLTIPAGKIVAIVGDNGAGKSTLIKLLCRFYDPESGCIKLDGIDIRDLSVTEYQRLITVLFQFPVSYYVTAAENIAFGDWSATPSLDEIELAAKDAGIDEKITSLPQGYNSILGKLFPTGTELSGGQWQRLALARAFLRRAEIIILDEPTSAMDPWAEFDWLERFRTMANGRTAVVITHRFTLAMRADIIHVMRAGKIVESGSHDELLAQNGFYAQSWKEQMSVNNNVSV
ncbi:ABC transporter-related protein [Calothrix sp. NIES-4071]|nr:ABC transporter-related protein [Calothrix sp. NIES-4071]BAZ57205.1 ABC transporter-related protein [Calothrix sp. NIES-4105]